MHIGYELLLQSNIIIWINQVIFEMIFLYTIYPQYA